MQEQKEGSPVQDVLACSDIPVSPETSVKLHSKTRTRTAFSPPMFSGHRYRLHCAEGRETGPSSTFARHLPAPDTL